MFPIVLSQFQIQLLGVEQGVLTGKKEDIIEWPSETHLVVTWHPSLIHYEAYVV